MEKGKRKMLSDVKVCTTYEILSWKQNVAWFSSKNPMLSNSELFMTNMLRRKNYQQENYGRYWKSVGTLSNIVTVIFRKRIITESRSWRKSNFCWDNWVEEQELHTIPSDICILFTLLAWITLYSNHPST